MVKPPIGSLGPFDKETPPMADPVHDEHENTKKWVLGALIVIAVLIVGIFVGRAIEDSNNQEDNEAAQKAFAAAVTTQQIEDLQTCLTAGGYYSGPIDGNYGSETTKAVEEYQEDHDLTVDGVAGHATEAQMTATGCAKTNTTTTSTTAGPTSTTTTTASTTTTTTG